MTQAVSNRVRVIPATPEHAQGMAEFFNQNWGSSSTPESVCEGITTAAAGNLAEPGRPLPTFVALQGDRVIGYCSTLSIRLWNGSAEVPAYLAKGLWVLSEFRNGPIGFHVLRALSNSEPLIGALTVNPASRRLFAALGYTDWGALPNAIRPLSLRDTLPRLDTARAAQAGVPRAVAKALGFSQQAGLAGAIGAMADVPIRLGMPRVSRRFHAAIEATLDPEAVDALWRDTRTELRGAIVRDSAAVLARYGNGSRNSDYSFATIHDAAHQLSGLAILKRPRGSGDERLGGVRVCSLSDLIVRPSDAGTLNALLATAEKAARAMGSDAILCSIPHESTRKHLRRRGFLNFAGNVHFFLKRNEAEPGWPLTLGEWWLARGDGESDATF